jgi:hypothetical protein
MGTDRPVCLSSFVLLSRVPAPDAGIPGPDPGQFPATGHYAAPPEELPHRVNCLPRRLNPDAEAALRALVDSIVDEIGGPSFRGCAFLNAAAEFPSALDPVRVAIARHRDWYTGYLAGLLQNLGHPLPGDASDELMLARDGAMSGGYAGDPIAATAALQRVAERVIRAAQTTTLTPPSAR